MGATPIEQACEREEAKLHAACYRDVLLTSIQASGKGIPLYKLESETWMGTWYVQLRPSLFSTPMFFDNSQKHHALESLEVGRMAKLF